MKKRIIQLLVAVSIVLASVTSAYAATDGKVEFNGNKMVSDFDSSKIAASISNLQPGDSTNYSVSFKNSSKISTEWYMLNDVLDTLEELNGERSGGAKPKNGAYTYTLSYQSNGKGIPEVIFSNDNVGGDTPNGIPLKGLHQATNATGKYFWLATLKPGQSGTVTLSIKLDPETENNSYMDTDAKLKLKFAVEKTGNGAAVQSPGTGDTTSFLPFVVLIAGIILLVIAFMLSRREEEEVQDE